MFHHGLGPRLGQVYERTAALRMIHLLSTPSRPYHSSRPLLATNTCWQQTLKTETRIFKDKAQVYAANRFFERRDKIIERDVIRNSEPFSCSIFVVLKTKRIKTLFFFLFFLYRRIDRCFFQMGDDFELHEYERKTPLVAAEESLKGSYAEVQPGDAVVAFSRKEIFMIKAQIEAKTKYKCCVVYGQLPQETRAHQARMQGKDAAKAFGWCSRARGRTLV